MKGKRNPANDIPVTAYLFTVCKWLIVLFLIVFFVRHFAGNKVSKTDFSEMEKAVLSHVDTETMKAGNNQMLKRLYGLSPSDFSDYTLYYPASNMGAEELLLIRLTDTSQQKMVEDAIKTRLAVQKKNFDGYGTYQAGMLEDSIVEIKGNYCLFYSGDDPAKVKQDFLKAY